MYLKKNVQMEQYCIKLKEQYTEKPGVPKRPNIKRFL